MYNGKEYEESLGLGLYEMDFRQYDPAIGRFISIDPLNEQVSSINPYHFSFNNPVSLSDPTGLMPGAEDLEVEGENEESSSLLDLEIKHDELVKIKKQIDAEFKEYLNSISTVTSNCEDCPNPDSNREYDEYISKDGKTYVLVAGNWVEKNKNVKQNDVTTVNDKDYFYFNGRWIPIFNTEGTLGQGTEAYLSHTFYVWGISSIFTKSIKMSGTGAIVDYVITVGETGLNNYKAYRERYFTKQEVKEIQNKARQLMLKYKGVKDPQTGKMLDPE